MYRRHIKRLLDIAVSLAGLLVLAVPMLAVAVLIELDSPGPVFFRQRRIGIHKTEFEMLKFRTMSTKAPADMPTHLLEDAGSYSTPFQSFLRRYSIDELPQLICVLKDQMSIIGPRPALWNQEDLIAERDRYGANDVLPGLTGWAQINGRDELPIEVKARYDGEYAERISFAFDCRCFFGTIGKVLHHDGVVEGGTGELEKREKEMSAK
ncbi:sugar transferase [uncultured Oscillibacter sp.]|uniref:sugar transferase n=1 Tax=uncultured Oscillibacter sp. TaxID=876091 RepID=UPI0025FD2E49|nr:sugar transferase [uncultured Oscillibacter sp.]